MGGILASLSASLAQLSPQGKEGIIYGVDASVVSVGNTVGPILGSTLATWLDLRVPFLVAAAIFAVAGVAAARLLPKR